MITLSMFAWKETTTYKKEVFLLHEEVSVIAPGGESVGHKLVDAMSSFCGVVG